MLRLGNRIRMTAAELEDFQQTVNCRCHLYTVEEYNQALADAAYYYNDACEIEMVEFCTSLKLQE